MELAAAVAFFLNNEADAGDAGGGAGVEDADGCAVGGVGVADDEEAFGSVALFAGVAELFGELLIIEDLRIFDPDRIVVFNADGDEVGVVLEIRDGLARGGDTGFARLGRGHIHHCFEGLQRSDEEEDQKEEDDIDHRGHVDEVFGMGLGRGEEGGVVVGRGRKC